MENVAIKNIEEAWHISLMEMHIKESIRHCKMWGDLNISQEEYNHIKSVIVTDLDIRSASGLKELFTRYPVVMVTDMICYVLYEYDNNDFWSGWVSRFKINIGVNSQTDIGRIVRQIFERYNFDIIEDGGYAYVTPILCQAGIPSSCFDKLFDILDSTLCSTYFSPREFVYEVMGYRSYLVDAPVARYFRLHTERAVELTIQVREMMHTLGEINSDAADMQSVSGVQQRIVRRYVQWKTEVKKLDRKSRKEYQYYFSPKLVYDTIKGVCIYVPEQTLRQDSIYKLKWTIIHDNDENSKTYFSQVYNINGRNFTREASVPVRVASKYTIELRDDDNDSALLTHPWRVDGLESTNDILVFNDNGSLSPSSQRNLSRKGTYIVMNNRFVCVNEAKNLNTVKFDLPTDWSGFESICAYATDKDARLTLNTSCGDINLECKQTFDVELVQTGTLFDERYNSCETPVYVRFPKIVISGNFDNYNEASLNNWQVIIAHRGSNTKQTVSFSELGYRCSDDTLRLALDEYAQQHFSDKFGTYDLRVYDGTTRKHLTFYLSPSIEYLAQLEDIQSDRNLDYRRAVFYIKKISNAQLEFENGVNVFPAPARGSDWVEVSTTSKPAYINGYVVLEQDSRATKIPFKKTIRKLHWCFWDESEYDIKEIGKTKQFYLEELKTSKWRFAVHFTGEADRYDTAKIVLESADSKPLQSKDIVTDKNGNCSTSLNLFLDTMEAHLLPQRLMIYLSEGYNDYVPICIAIIKSYVQLKSPKYAVFKGQPIVYWLKSRENKFINKRLQITSLSDHTAESLKYQLAKIKALTNKAGRPCDYIELGLPLKEGIYYIDATEDVESLFFDDEEQAIPVYNSEHIFCVNGEQVLKKFIATKSNHVLDWLSAATVALYKDNWINVIYEKLRNQIEHSKMIFDPKTCSSLLFLLLLNCGDKSNLPAEIKSKAKEVCMLINDFIIMNIDRAEVLKLLLKSSITDSECYDIINDLQLYLFTSNSSVKFEKPLVQRMWEINEKIAILMNLRGCVSNVSADIERVMSRIGSEALQEIIKITPAQGCRSHNWQDCFELILSEVCQCRYKEFECSKKVWGDAKEFAQLFVADKKGNYLRLVPDENHTDGYEILGMNYLRLKCKLIPENPDNEMRTYIEQAKSEIYKIDNLCFKYAPYLPTTFSTIRSRLGDNVNREILFYQVGCASVLGAVSSYSHAFEADLQELLPFWKHAIRAYPDLVYRDLIVAELYLLFYMRGE